MGIAGHVDRADGAGIMWTSVLKRPGTPMGINQELTAQTKNSVCPLNKPLSAPRML
jgi:hypothetical protein